MPPAAWHGLALQVLCGICAFAAVGEKMNTAKAKLIFKFVARNWVVTSILAFSLLQACSNNNNNSTQSGSGSLSCVSSAALVSGADTAGSTDTVNNIVVDISNGTGPYSITLPGQTAVTSSTSDYQSSSTISITNGTSAVSVTDTSTSTATSCVIVVPSPVTSLPSITPSPSASVIEGNTITLVAVATDGNTSPTFTFTLAASITGVTLTTISNTEAQVTSTVATPVTVVLTESSGSTVTETTSINLTFLSNASGSSSAVAVSASPSTTTTVGSSITVLAQDTAGYTNPVFDFTWSSSLTSGISLSPVGTNETIVSSSEQGTVTINVNEYSSGNLVSTGVITLTFTSSSGGGSSNGISCSLSVGAQYTYMGYSVIPFTVSSSTYGFISVTQIGTTQTCDYFSKTDGFLLWCPPGSTEVVNVLATVGGVSCNSGSPMSTTVNY